MKLESYSFVGKVAIVLAVVVAVFFAVMAVDAATTISTNISTGGTLTVDLGSTLTGAVAVSSSLTRQNEIWDYNSSGNIVSPPRSRSSQAVRLV